MCWEIYVSVTAKDEERSRRSETRSCTFTCVMSFLLGHFRIELCLTRLVVCQKRFFLLLPKRQRLSIRLAYLGLESLMTLQAQKSWNICSLYLFLEKIFGVVAWALWLYSLIIVTHIEIKKKKRGKRRQLHVYVYPQRSDILFLMRTWTGLLFYSFSLSLSLFY